MGRMWVYVLCSGSMVHAHLYGVSICLAGVDVYTGMLHVSMYVACVRAHVFCTNMCVCYVLCMRITVREVTLCTRRSVARTCVMCDMCVLSYGAHGSIQSMGIYK